MIDLYPQDQYDRRVQQLKENPIPEKMCRNYNEFMMLFITSDNQLQDLTYEGYPIFEELGVSKDDFIRWSKYMALDRDSVEYAKAYRECICNMAAWQWKFSRLLQKPNGVVSHNAVMHYYLLELERLDKKLGLGFSAGYE